MQLKWRKWNRAIHRDFGYLFFGMTLIYCISGIAINHLKDWNPNYVITVEEYDIRMPEDVDKTSLKALLKTNDIENRYLNHYYPEEGYLKVFLKDGTFTIDMEDETGLLEITRRRKFFKPMNYLHYNPIKYWTWYSDIFSGALILLAITGLFIARGTKGISKRGAWLTVFGILIPLIFLFMFYF